MSASRSSCFVLPLCCSCLHLTNHLKASSSSWRIGDDFKGALKVHKIGNVEFYFSCILAGNTEFLSRFSLRQLTDLETSALGVILLKNKWFCNYFWSMLTKNSFYTCKETQLLFIHNSARDSELYLLMKWNKYDGQEWGCKNDLFSWGLGILLWLRTNQWPFAAELFFRYFWQNNFF